MSGFPQPRGGGGGRGGGGDKKRGRGGGGGRGGGRGDAGAAGREGDWQCPKGCGNVFASKPACFKCGEPKPGGGGGAVAPQANGGGGGFHAPAANGGGEPRGGAPGHHVVMAQKDNKTSTTAFAALGLSPNTMRAITEIMKFTHATTVQDQTLPHCLRGLDILARAKTGSGKTVAFLLPSIEALLKSGPVGKGAVSCLILSPTRELASQIHEEAKSLLTFHNLGAQVVFGGTNINSERTRMNNSQCDFLVATPGRLIDHFQTSGLAPRCANLKVLVLDEADQLLEMGFKPSIDKILTFIPRERQTLLFSATVPKTVQNIAANALRKGYAYVDCVGEEDSATNLQVKQWLTLSPS